MPVVGDAGEIQKTLLRAMSTNVACVTTTLLSEKSLVFGSKLVGQILLGRVKEHVTSDI